MTTYFSDLDGVITDSASGLIRCFEEAFAALGAPELDQHRLHTFLGTPLPAAFRDVLPNLSDAEVEQGIDAFREAYSIYGVAGNELYDGVRSLLGKVKRKSGGIWIVTTKPQPFAEQVIEFLAIGEFVSGIIGASLAENDTKADLIKIALARSGSDPSATVMLGDRNLDVEGAIANQILPVGALWGYGSKEELVAAGCQAFAETPAAFESEFVENFTP